MKLKHLALGLVIVSLAVGSLVGCGSMQLKATSLNGHIFGNTYTIDAFNDYGDLVVQTHGEKIDIKGEFISTPDVDSNGNIIYDKDLSSVVKLTIDGHAMNACGNTLIFYEDGLIPDVNFVLPKTIDSTSDSITDNTIIAGAVNEVKNSFGKAVTIVVQSELGIPIYAFSGNSVTSEIPNNLPKFTKLTVDGKALYLHRCDYMLIDTALLQ